MWNYAIKSIPKNDIFILHPSAIPGGYWNYNLTIVGKSKEDIATVSPMSANFPALGMASNKFMANWGENQNNLAIPIERSSLALTPALPTGNPFCIYINNNVLSEIGAFDESLPWRHSLADFCMRALRAGLQNVLDEKTYVEIHTLDNKMLESDTGSEANILAERYPEYPALMRALTQDIQIDVAKIAIKNADMNSQLLSKARVLFITESMNGFIADYLLNLCNIIKNSVKSYWLRREGKQVELREYDNNGWKLIWSDRARRAANCFNYISDEYDSILAGIIHGMGIDLIHILQLRQYSLNAPIIAKKLGRAVIYSLHDDYVFSPYDNLLDGMYSTLGNIFDDYSAYLKHISYEACEILNSRDYRNILFRRISKSLAECQIILGPTSEALNLARKLLPEIPEQKFKILFTPTNTQTVCEDAPVFLPGERFRLIIPHDISYGDSKEFVENLAAFDQAHANILEFHIFGKPSNIQHIHAVGDYLPESFAALTGEIKPHGALLPSTFPKAWNPALFAAWGQNLPAFILNPGAQAELLSATGAGWILPDEDISECYSKILSVIFDIEKNREARRALSAWRRQFAQFSEIMEAYTYSIYQEARDGLKRPIVGACLPQGEAETNAMIEACANELRRNAAYGFLSLETLIMPAVAKQLQIVLLPWVESLLPLYENIGKKLRELGISWAYVTFYDANAAIAKALTQPNATILLSKNKRDWHSNRLALDQLIEKLMAKSGRGDKHD